MRLKLAVSQTECASKLGISQTHLSNIEHGRSGITLQMLCRVCDILQVSLDYLVRGAEKTDEQTDLNRRPTKPSSVNAPTVPPERMNGQCSKAIPPQVRRNWLCAR